MRTASLWVNSESVVVVETDAARKILHRSRLSSIAGLVNLSLLIVFILFPSALGAQEDPWLDSLKDAKGMKVGSRVPRFGDLERPERTAVPETPSVETGDTDARDQGRREATDTRSVDPKKEDTARLIREWITTARPPENAVEGNNVCYSNKGNVIGTVRGGVIESRHETGGIDPVYLWTNKKQLDSIDHCTMEQYVVARLKNESISRCAGRYGAVRNLKGMLLADAKAVVTRAGFEPIVAPGSPAKTAEQNGTIERQEPGPEIYLRKGQTLTLTVHSPYVPAGVVLPDFTGKRLGESRKWLEEQSLIVKVNPGAPAPVAEKSGTIEKQGPAPGTQVKEGDTVSLTVHSNYVSNDLLNVPDLRGLFYPDAKRKLEALGLSIVWRDGGLPNQRALADTFQKQEPSPGTKVSKGSTVFVWYYGEYTPTREDQVAAADCSRIQGSRAYWDNNLGKPQCGCFGGLTLNLAKTRCVTVDAHADELCARDLPGTVARGKMPDGKINCVCLEGYIWNASSNRCERQLSPQELCTRHHPGSIAQGTTVDGRVNCVCPQGSHWAAGKTHCVKLSPQEICAQHRPGSIYQGMLADGKINCVCPQGYRWAADNRSCVKQPVGPPITITPGSCNDQGMTLTYCLRNPPPYGGSTFICNDSSGRSWLQTEANMHLIQSLVRGQLNRQTGCHDGSSVVTPSRTFPGSLCKMPCR
jgi:beta-lactam-binding protein with PASTA domain